MNEPIDAMDELRAIVPRVLPAMWSEIVSPVAFTLAYRRKDGLAAIVGLEQNIMGRWLHASFSRAHKLPSYDDLIEVKELFIGSERQAVQIFPPRWEWVNIHPHTLHLWCLLDRRLIPDMRQHDCLGRLVI